METYLSQKKYDNTPPSMLQVHKHQSLNHVHVLTKQKARRGREGRERGLQALHSDKSHDYTFQPGGPEEGWRTAEPEGSSGGLGRKT